MYFGSESRVCGSNRCGIETMWVRPKAVIGVSVEANETTAWDDAKKLIDEFGAVGAGSAQLMAQHNFAACA